MNQPLLQIRELKKYFLVEKRLFAKSGKYLKAVDGITFDLNSREVLGLVGESGSGKSTVAYTVAGMYKPTSGNIIFQGHQINLTAVKRPLAVKKDLQIVFQDPGSSLNPRRNIRQILERPLLVYNLATSRNVRSKVEELLKMVELPREYMLKYPREIGGGERQLIAIARALASQPKLLILDEPTSALDVSIQAKIINTLSNLQREFGLSYLFITHDLSLMRNVADRVAIMYLGKILEIAPTVDFFRKPLHPYTQMLLSAIPTINKEEEELKPKKVPPTGEIPSPVNPPTGCRFNTRCPLKFTKCEIDEPVFKEIEPGHWVSCHLVSKLEET
ncbi:MAG: ABC transporter ATP-binding protein [Caldiserica bacterium]|jgi:peptide/nickel transport system ATP-binding protein|nr:ABC transporter ATP-binding protein [Caldisericota bacterium]